MDGAYPYPESIPPQPGPGNSTYGAYGAPAAGPPPSYPTTLPPAVEYPSGGGNNTKRILLVVGAVLAVVAVVGGIIFAVRSTSDRGLTDATAKSAIQGYLNALLQQDKQAVARHALCGLYDGVKDHATDYTVANLASDAFRKQFGQADVTSIDKIVMLSPNQAQVLFTMKVAPSGRLPRGSVKSNEFQAVAQLLVQPRETLVCSYLPRPADSL
ncbi:Rv0361 family membrane protein [Mycobacterium sp. HM-7]